MLDRCGQHAGQLQVNTEIFAAIHLVGRIQTAHGLTRNAPLARLFKGEGFRVWGRELGGIQSHLSVRDRAAGNGVGDDPLFSQQFAHGHLPTVGGSLHEHQAGGSTPAPHVVVRGADAAAATSGHIAPSPFAGQALAWRGHFGGDFGPIAIQLFGHQLRQAGSGALPHFGAGNANHTGVIRLDHHPNIDFVGSEGGVRGCRHSLRQKA